MRLRFSLWQTLISAPAFALLIGLGVWQLDRGEEKRAAIAAFGLRAEGQVSPTVAAAWCDPDASPEGLRVAGPLATLGAPIRFYAQHETEERGWRLMARVEAPRCACLEGDASCDEPVRHVLVDVGFETLGGRVAPAPERLRIEATPRPSVFSPPNDVPARTFYRFDAAEIAAALEQPAGGVIDDLWLVRDGAGLPPVLASVPPSRHWGYALTWFGLAAALVGVLVAQAWSRGRR